MVALAVQAQVQNNKNELSSPQLVSTPGASTPRAVATTSSNTPGKSYTYMVLKTSSESGVEVVVVDETSKMVNETANAALKPQGVEVSGLWQQGMLAGLAISNLGKAGFRLITVLPSESDKPGSYRYFFVKD